jgi:NADH-quinone oxidoreductase subunit L
VPTGILISLVLLFAPIVGGMLIGVFGKKLKNGGDVIGIAALCTSLACAIALFLNFGTYGGQHWEFTWLTVGGIDWNLGITIDGLTVALLMVVTIVSCIVHFFSKGYMHGDDRYSDFFRWLGLFTFSMLGLVLSDNLLTLFIFWEIMGLASYKLIGHYFFKRSAYLACKKAFMTTRIGDLGMFLALLALYLYTGSLQFDDIFARTDMIPGGAHTWIALGLFMGAAGKSAQFPLHIWLPDAMEGPTPVSALIHAATMVAAGVYLVGRMYALIALSPVAMLIISIIGCFTAFGAATIAFTRTDIKQVLAYSTVSQLGFMFTALGVGSNIAWQAGLFHLVTHAFFKAGLFLGSGSVIHGCHHEQDMTKMGGLHKKMPITSITFGICCLSIAGFPLTAGFASKDMILQALWAGNGEFDMAYKVIFFVLAFAALMTACYMFRCYLLTFWGKPRDHHIHDHAHESPLNMTAGLIVLATLAIAAGYYWPSVLLANDVPVLAGSAAAAAGDTMVGFVKVFDLHDPNGVAHHAHTTALIASSIVMSLGIGLACIWYLTAMGERFRKACRATVSGIYGWAFRKYYVDEAVEACVIQVTIFLAEISAWFDSQVLDGFVDGTGSVYMKTSDASGSADDGIVDGAVTLAGNAAWSGGGLLARFQSGRVRNYLFGAVASAALFAVFMLYVAN